MASKNQPDLFAADAQPDLFGADAAPPVYRPDPDRVRRRLERILGEARAAQTMPWDWSKKSLYKTIFPQMSLWLPDDEAEEWRFRFEREMERLEAV